MSVNIPPCPFNLSHLPQAVANKLHTIGEWKGDVQTPQTMRLIGPLPRYVGSSLSYTQETMTTKLSPSGSRGLVLRDSDTPIASVDIYSGSKDLDQAGFIFRIRGERAALPLYEALRG